MLIDLKTIAAGPSGILRPGPVDVPQKLGKLLIDGGYASRAEPKPPAKAPVTEPVRRE